MTQQRNAPSAPADITLHPRRQQFSAFRRPRCQWRKQDIRHPWEVIFLKVTWLTPSCPSQKSNQGHTNSWSDSTERSARREHSREANKKPVKRIGNNYTAEALTPVFVFLYYTPAFVQLKPLLTGRWITSQKLLRCHGAKENSEKPIVHFYSRICIMIVLGMDSWSLL